MKRIDIVYHTAKKVNVCNIGGRNERTNLQVIDTICSIVDEKVPRNSRHPELDSGSSYKELILFIEDRAGDATKLETELGWKADENFEIGIVKTIDCYKKVME